MEANDIEVVDVSSLTFPSFLCVSEGYLKSNQLLYLFSLAG